MSGSGSAPHEKDSGDMDSAPLKGAPSGCAARWFMGELGDNDNGAAPRKRPAPGHEGIGSVSHATLPPRITFRDPNGRLHRWHGRIKSAKDGRLIVTRVAEDGSSYGSTTRKPGQYFIACENLIRVVER